MTFSQKLNKLLKETGLSKYRFANDIGVSQSTVRNWIKEKSKPNSINIKKIADYFGVTWECLFYNDVDGLIYIVKAINNN